MLSFGFRKERVRQMDRIWRKVSVVIAVADACTARAVDYTKCRVMMTDEKSANIRNAIAKPGGFYVLTDIEEEVIRVTVQGEGYQPTELSLPIKASEVYHVFLIPDREAKLPYGTSVLTGSCGGSRMQVITQRSGTEGRLAADAKKGASSIGLYPSNEQREGRNFALLDKEGKWEEIILTEESESASAEFMLKTPLRHSYDKGTTLLCNLFDVPIREDGSYFLPFSGFPQENGIVLVYVDGRKVEAGDVQSGKECRLDC